MAKKGGLGKGLGAFGLGKNNNISKSLRDSVQSVKEEPKVNHEAEQPAADLPVFEVAIDDIKANPHQPRAEFEPEALESLKESISQYGVLQPILVRKTTKGYELIAGERRFRAAQLAGLKTIPAITREYNDAQMAEVAIIENIQRENLNPMEEAQAYQHLLSDYGLTQEMLSHKVGRSRSHIANFLRLLKLSAKAQELLVGGQISMGQAKPLLSLEDEELQDKAVEFIVANELSARKVEELVKKLQKHPDFLDEKEETDEDKHDSKLDVFYLEAQDKLKMLFGTGVRIKPRGKKQSLEIDFASQEELNNLIHLLELAKQKPQMELSNEEKLAKLREFSTTGKFTV